MLESSVTLTDNVFNPTTCGVKVALLLKGLVEKLLYSAVDPVVKKLLFDQMYDSPPVPPTTLAVTSCDATELVAKIPVIVTDKGVPRTFDCAELAVKAGVEASVTVQVTVFSPTRAGVKVGLEPLVESNSVVLVLPSGLTFDQLKT